MNPKVVQLRESPSLNDIPGMLRKLAEDIEAGVHGDVSSAYVLLPAEGDYPKIFGFGDVTGEFDPIVQCELAKAWFVENRVRRA